MDELSKEMHVFATPHDFRYMASGEQKNYHSGPRNVLSYQRLSTAKNVNSVNFIYSKIVSRILRSFVSTQGSLSTIHKKKP